MADRVFVTRTLPEPGTDLLVEAGLDVVVHTADRAPNRDELQAGVAAADAVLCMLTERIDAGLLAAAPKLRIVANLAVGYDNVDLDAAAARGVVVTNTPDVLTEATADLAWALLLAAARRVGEGERLVRSGAWSGWTPTQLIGWPVAGATLGIFGLGAIGQAVALRASGFDMRVLTTTRTARPDVEAAVGAVRVDLDVLLAESDFVVLCAPATDATRHMIDAAALARMRRHAVLVNVARGPLVDEVALVSALRDGVIGAAGLDVYEREPALADGLAAFDNVVLLPHLGSATTDARAAMVSLASNNIIRVLRGQDPLTPVR